MKYYDLDKDEQAIIDSVESGEWTSVDNVKSEIKKAKSSAEATLSKQANINIRLSHRDVFNLKVKAAQEGIPYQTLAASILHKAVM